VQPPHLPDQGHLDFVFCTFSGAVLFLSVLFPAMLVFTALFPAWLLSAAVFLSGFFAFPAAAFSP